MGSSAFHIRVAVKLITEIILLPHILQRGILKIGLTPIFGYPSFVDLIYSTGDFMPSAE